MSLSNSLVTPKKKGDRLSNVSIQVGTHRRNKFEWKDADTGELFKDKRVVVFSFTGSIKDFVKTYQSILAQGVDDVYCVSIDDRRLMERHDGTTGSTSFSNVKWIHDSALQFTLDMGLSSDAVGRTSSYQSYYTMVVNNMIIEELFNGSDDDGITWDSTASEILGVSVKPDHAKIVHFYLMSCPVSSNYFFEHMPKLSAVRNNHYSPQDHIIGLCSACIREGRIPSRIYSALFAKMPTNHGLPTWVPNGMEMVNFFQPAQPNIICAQKMRIFRDHFRRHFTRNDLIIKEHMLPIAMQLPGVVTRWGPSEIDARGHAYALEENSLKRAPSASSKCSTAAQQGKRQRVLDDSIEPPPSVLEPNLATGAASHSKDITGKTNENPIPRDVVSNHSSCHPKLRVALDLATLPNKGTNLEECPAIDDSIQQSNKDTTQEHQDQEDATAKETPVQEATHPTNDVEIPPDEETPFDEVAQNAEIPRDEEPPSEEVATADTTQTAIAQMAADVEVYERSLTILTRRVSELKSEKEDGLRRVASTNAKLDAAVAKTSTLELELEESEKLLQVQEREIQDRDQKINNLKKEVHELRKSKAAMESNLQQELSEAKAEIARLRTTIASAEAHKIAFEEEQRAKARLESIRKKAALNKILSTTRDSFGDILGCWDTEPDEGEHNYGQI